MDNIAISLQKITKQYGNRIVLNECDLNVQKGTFTMIFGESGAGKSTLLNIVSLIDKPSSGNCFIDGIQVIYSNDKLLNKIRKEKIGIVFQMYYLVPHLTVKENILLPYLYRKIFPESNIESKVSNLLEEFGMLDKINQPIELLSGGEKQRTAIITNPSILICDEPTGNLDHANTISIIEELKKISERGTTIVMVTHNRELIDYSDQSYELKRGKLNLIKNG